MSATRRLALGSALAAISGTGIMLSIMNGWTSLPRPWGFLVGMAFGVAGGLGVTLAVFGLLRCLRDTAEPSGPRRSSP